MPGAMPVPVSAAVAGLPLKLPPILRLPERVPATVGLKLTCTVQLPPAPSEVPQVVACREKSPVIAGVWRVTAMPPEFVAVNVTGGEMAFSTNDPKFSDGGESVRFPGATPVPLSAAVAGLPVKLPGTERVPVRAPTADGVKSTISIQLLPAARELPHVVETIAKSPPTEGVPSVTGAPPLLPAVKAAAVEVWPSTTVPKLLEPGESTRLPGARPFPDNDEVAGLVAKPPAMLSNPVRWPVADGVNAT